MTMYFILNGRASPWAGEAINEVTYPLNIEQLWSPAELATIGLYAPVVGADTPAGQRLVSSTVGVVSGVVTAINVFEPIPAPVATDFILQPYQFWAMISIANLQPSIDNALAKLSDPVQKAVATAKLNHTLSFHRNDPLVALLSADAGLTTAQVDAYWLQAAAIP
jgi:hypothetical protein